MAVTAVCLPSALSYGMRRIPLCSSRDFRNGVTVSAATRAKWRGGARSREGADAAEQEVEIVVGEAIPHEEDRTRMEEGGEGALKEGIGVHGVVVLSAGEDPGGGLDQGAMELEDVLARRAPDRAAAPPP
jgi:hypothetical protein